MVPVDRFTKILVVDDYRSMVDMLHDLLSELGFDNVDAGPTAGRRSKSFAPTATGW